MAPLIGSVCCLWTRQLSRLATGPETHGLVTGKTLEKASTTWFRCSVPAGSASRYGLSWGQMNAQEELESYEETMHNDCGLGEGRVPTELSEIGRIEGSMTELVRISRSKALLQSSSGSVVPRLYDSSHGNWFEDASITNLAAGGQQTRRAHHLMK
ncbi:uncharacterized protein UBRO_20243 [Ustilago bromivora]|uniref:Uncharacterized protein n=1 Tax=Ustilago bromivora TaxID=307758 RepID=A0A1K0H0A6_9BASI|nr:uncharacterized protein UBRO_20243 [Ustilago bromivora]